MRNEDLLFISTNRFSALPTRKQRFAKHFREIGFRILFVEPPATYFALLKNRSEFLKSLGSYKNGVKQVENSFFVATTPPWLPFFKKNLFINRMDNNILTSYFQKLFDKIHFIPQITWSYMPFLPYSLEKIYSKKIYDCVDDHSAYPGLLNPNIVDILEKKTVQLSDVVITTNKVLKNKLKRYDAKKDIETIGNGVDWKLFSSPLLNSSHIKIKKRIIYVGAIAEWFDQGIIKKIAKSLPDWELLLIGPISVNASSLAKYKNITFQGKLLQKDIAPLLAESACAIIPFKVNRLTKNIDPLKIYEYLAAGVPVVSTPVGGLQQFKTEVEISNDADKFVNKIVRLTKYDSIEKRIARSKIVKKHSWENKYKEIDRILEKLKE